jgi:hypothetical protein
LFYLACGVGSALTYIAFSPDHFASTIPEGGASGAISACIGGYLLLRANAHIHFIYFITFWVRFWSGDFSMPAWVVITCWFLKDFGLMLLSAAINSKHGGVAFGAHVGGTMLGAGFVALVKLTSKQPLVEEEEERIPTITRTVKPVSAIPSSPRAEARVIPLRSAAVSAPALEPEPAATAPSPATAPGEPGTIYLSWNGAQSGPFTASQIRQMFAAGQIPDPSFYWQEGMGNWANAEELRGIE